MLLLSLVLLAAPVAGTQVKMANCPEPVVEILVDQESAMVSTELQPPIVKTRVDPKYPADIDKALKVRARVTVEGTVDIDGNVWDITTQSCSITMDGTRVEGADKKKYCAAFIAAAESSFSGWRYAPAVKNGKNVCVYQTASFAFGRQK